MTVIGATLCGDGVFIFADSKRVDLLASDVILPAAEKLLQILPWATIATAGAGSLAAALRLFLRSVLFPFPPSLDEVLAESERAMIFMHDRFFERTGSGQGLSAILACCPPDLDPQIWTFDSSNRFVPNRLPDEVPFYTRASDTGAAFRVLQASWQPDVRLNRDAAVLWAFEGVKKLSESFDSIGLPVQAHVHHPSGEWLECKLATWPPGP